MGGLNAQHAFTLAYFSLRWQKNSLKTLCERGDLLVVERSLHQTVRLHSV